MASQVLLVDDDDFARCFVKTVLLRSGYEVIEASDVAGALGTAEVSQLSAVVTDWNLPDGNGGDLARLLHERSANLPIVLISGDALEVDSLPGGVEKEFAAILQKPFSPSKLERVLGVAIDGQANRAAKFSNAGD